MIMKMGTFQKILLDDEDVSVKSYFMIVLSNHYEK